MRNKISSFKSKAFFLHCRTVEDLPKPLQLHLMILIVVREADLGQLPNNPLDYIGIPQYVYNDSKDRNNSD